MTIESMPAFIEEANELYKTDPAGAVALLYEGTRKLREKMPDAKESIKKAREQRSEKDRKLMLLESAHGLMEYLHEDAEGGFFPDSLEWAVDVGVAQDIVRMTREYGI